MSQPPPVSRNSKPSSISIPMEPLLPPRGIIYSLIARENNIVLAENSAAANFGNFVTVSRVILDKVRFEGSPTRSYAYDDFAFHFLFKDSLKFMCMTDGNYPRRYALAFLEEISSKFFQNYSIQSIGIAVAFQMNQSFSPILQSQMKFFSSDPSLDKLAVVKKQIDDTKNMMLENIERVLSRGEKIDLLVERTDNLETQSFHFKKQSKKLYWAIFVKNIKLIILFGIIAIILIWLGTSLICGFNYACLSFL